MLAVNCRQQIDRKCSIFSYVYTEDHKTSTLQILGNVSELIRIFLFRNLVFSILDLIVHPLMARPGCLYPAMQKLFVLILSRLSFYPSLSHQYSPKYFSSHCNIKLLIQLLLCAQNAKFFRIKYKNHF